MKVCNRDLILDTKLNAYYNLTGVPQLSLGQKAILTATPDYVSLYMIHQNTRISQQTP